VVSGPSHEAKSAANGRQFNILGFVFAGLTAASNYHSVAHLPVAADHSLIAIARYGLCCGKRPSTAQLYACAISS